MQETGNIDDFEIEKVLVGNGVLGVIISLVTDGFRKVIIKQYRSYDSPYLNKVIRYLINNEKRNLHYLKQRGITAAVDIFNGTDEMNYLVLEYLSKGTLYDLIFRLSQKKIPPSEDLTRVIFRMLISNVRAIHAAGVVHLDIKPENIMFSRDNIMKLIDFGHSCCVDNRVTIPHANVGTKQYQAPEVIGQMSFVPKPADIYSLGVTLFFIHFRKYPFSEAKVKDENYKSIIDEDYDSFVTRIKEETKCEVKPSLESLIQLIIGMILYAPETRLTLKEIIGHPWMVGATQEQNKKGENELRDLLNKFY